MSGCSDSESDSDSDFEDSGIYQFLGNKTDRPSALEIETVEAAETFVKSRPVVIFGFFKDRESDDAKT